jgi:hypothetical protein
MEIKPHIDDNLSDLGVISLLQEGVKISLRNGRIVHEKPKGGDGFMSSLSNAMNSMKRWLNNDNRTSGMNEINRVIQQSFIILNDANDSYVKMYKELYPKVIVGLENYRRTYGDDPYIISRCNIIITNLQTYFQDCT